MPIDIGRMICVFVPAIELLFHLFLGNYMYIEASYPRIAGHKARLVSQDLAVSKAPKCLNFWFHLYGASIGRLNVLVKTGSGNKSENLIWTFGGNFGDVWLNAQAPIQSDKVFQVMILLFCSVHDTLNTIAYHTIPYHTVYHTIA